MNKNDQITTVVSFVLFLILVFFFALTLAVRYRKRKKENDALRAQIVEERLKIQVEIQEEILQYISGELHDNLGHIASLIKINLNVIQPLDETIIERIEDTKNLTRQLIMDIKLLSVRLGNNQAVQNGIVPAIVTEIERLNKTGIFFATFDVVGDIYEIGSDKNIILYRMVQEVINNLYLL